MPKRMAETVSTTVMTGRRMKRSEIVTVARSFDACAASMPGVGGGAGAGGGRGRGRRGGCDHYLGVGHDGHLAGDDDALAAFDAVFDDEEIALMLTGEDGAQLGGVIGADDVDVGALLADLLRFCGDEDGVLARREDEADVYELAGPEIVIGVVDGGAEADGSAGALHRVVEEGEAAGARAARHGAG